MFKSYGGIFYRMYAHFFLHSLRTFLRKNLCAYIFTYIFYVKNLLKRYVIHKNPSFGTCLGSRHISTVMYNEKTSFFTYFFVYFFTYIFLRTFFCVLFYVDFFYVDFLRTFFYIDFYVHFFTYIFLRTFFYVHFLRTFFTYT